MKQYTAIVDGQHMDIALDLAGDRIEMVIEGRKYAIEVTRVQPDTFWWTWNHRSFEIVVSESGDGYVVSIGRHRIPVEVVDSRKALRRAAPHGHDGAMEVRAPMPGKIVRLLVEEGSEVEANQGLLVMEAMKMQNEIKSPKKGRVVKLLVVQGSAVSSGDLIATVE